MSEASKNRVHWGTTRIVLLIGGLAFKMPSFRSYKMFLRGILANLDENMWFRSSPQEWKEKMCPTVFCLGGLILIAKRAHPITDKVYDGIDFKEYDPLPMDKKIENFGFYNGRVVLVDYADTRYFCSDCESIFKRQKLTNGK